MYGLSTRSAAGVVNETRAVQLSTAIKADILRGVHAPGTRLRLEDLRTRFAVSWSPLREALSSLVTAGLIVSDGGRAYRVAPIARSELACVRDMRQMLETKALKMSIAAGDDAWEVRLLTTHHALRKAESEPWESRQLDAWEQVHRDFHLALIGACGSTVLLQYCVGLYDVSDRYRRLFLAVHPRDRNIADEHDTIFQATLARDAVKASELLCAHVTRTLNCILDVMPAEEREAAAMS
ncbi:MAG: FCD domain-containing protein [Bacteroidetes bacterium]|nr:FCD domain-containing protein [Bacteroidota bacterium]